MITRLRGVVALRQFYRKQNDNPDSRRFPVETFFGVCSLNSTSVSVDGKRY